jgi:Pup-ligase protein
VQEGCHGQARIRNPGTLDSNASVEERRRGTPVATVAGRDESSDLRPESEHGVTCTHEGRPVLAADMLARYLFEGLVPGPRYPNVCLENGARLDVDTGFHPEYATPECDDLIALVAHARADERLVEDLVSRADRRLRFHGIVGRIQAFKNNTDSAGNSYGCHENYLVSRETPFPRLVGALIPFLVSPSLPATNEWSAWRPDRAAGRGDR